MITTALKISILILGVYATMQDGMIFAFLRQYVQTILDHLFGVEFSQWLQKPLFGCLICMSSVWGITFGLILGVKLIDLPIMILLVCGINVILVNAVKYFEHE